MSDVILQVENLGITFGGLKAVEGFHLTMGKSELVGLIGPNGAGKTTIFNLLTGVYQPTDGSILMEGKSMAGKKPHQRVEAGIARTFQNIRLFKGLSVLENVQIALGHSMKYSILESIVRAPSYWREEAATKKRAMELLAVLGLQDYAGHEAANLPYGQQRKLEIARALATGAKILLLDEPAAGMNPTETAELMDAIQTIRQDFGLSILLIEHDMSLVMSVCERIVVIDYGHIIASGTPYEIANDPKVIGAYLGADDE